MRTIVFRGVPLLSLLLLIGLTEKSSEGSARLQKKEIEKGTAKQPPPTTRFPPGTVVAVYENVLDALKLMPPGAFVLAPEKYKAMMDEIDRLKKQIERPNARTPSRVALKGKIEGNLAILTATYEFETEEPNESIRLGGAPALATGVSVDGRTPRLRCITSRGTNREEEGFVVEIDKPGDHQLTLDLVLGVSPTATAQGIALNLPRAAITTLDLELPPGSREVKLEGKPLSESLLTLKGNKLTGGLGPIEKLDLSWLGAGAAASTAILEADGQIVARVEKREAAIEVVTEARLTLKVRGGQTDQWRLVVPHRAEVKVDPEDESRIAKIEPTHQKQASLYVIRLKEPSAAALRVTVNHVGPAPKPGSGKAISLGPFSVLGAVREVGTLLVCNSIPDWHLEFNPLSDLTRRGPTDDELKREPNLVAAFRYGPGGGPRRGGPSWLDLEAESVRGQIKTRSAHVFTLSSDQAGRPRWQVQSSLTVTPRWPDVDRLVVQLPADCTFVEDGSFPLPDRVRGLTHDASNNTVEFRLARAGTDASLTPFTLRVEGTLPVIGDLKNAKKSQLSPPLPLGTIEQEGTITVQAPPSIELIAPATTPGLELTRQTTHELIWRYPRKSPSKIDLAWQPYRPAVQVTSLVDVTLLPGEAAIRHVLRYQLPEVRPQSSTRLNLRVPASIATRVQLRDGGRMVESGIPPLAIASVIPNEPRQPVLTLEYRVPFDAGKLGEPIAIPLVVPDQITRGETRVRTWSEGGPLPVSAPGWAEQNVEIVPDRSRLPVLVVRTERIDQPLTLNLSANDGRTSVIVERTLARVRISTDGMQAYHVSHRLARLATRSLDVELPAPAATIGLELRLDDHLLTPEPVTTERIELRGRLVRVRLAPNLVSKPTTLDVRYHLDPSRVQGSPLRTPLSPPILVGEPTLVPTRWQVTVEGNQILLAPENGPGTSIQWGLRGWLPAPKPAITTLELERWFTGNVTTNVPPSVLSPSLVFWHDGSQPIVLTHVPRLAWQLACSLALVFLGVALWRASSLLHHPVASTAIWLLLLLVVVSILAVVFLRPTFAAEMAHGCLPGVAVLVLVGAIHWLRNERYRRRIVFLPSFSPPRGGSSLVRPDPIRPTHGEPSTVDVPRAVGSSVERAG